MNTTLKDLDITFIFFDFTNANGLDDSGSTYVFNNSAELVDIQCRADEEVIGLKGSRVRNIVIER